MEKIKISVIVPVYKIKETLLRKCLESFISQNYRNVEFIIVDDGSPDKCGEICDEYSKLDDRIKAFHKKNEGVSVARNYGLSIASGEYVIFVDGDDYIEKDAIENLVNNISDDTDIIFFKYKKLYENEEKEVENYKYSNISLDYKEIAKVIVSNDEKKIGYEDVCYGSPWGKVFKNEYLIKNKITFPIGIKKSQDRIFMLRALSFSPKTILIDFYGYCYIENKDSICQAYNPQIVEILNNAANEFENTINNYYVDEMKCELLDSYNYLQYDFLYNMFRLFYFNSANKHINYQEYINLCKEKRKYYIKCSNNGMGKKKKLILFFLKHKMYFLIYIIMGKIVRMT